MDPIDGAIEAEGLRELRDAFGQLAAKVGGLHERMDFAERLINAHRESERLGQAR